MPQSLLNKLSSGDLQIRRVLWASIDKTGRYWCAENFATGSVHYELPTSSGLQQHILNSGAQYVSWPDYNEVAAAGENGVTEGDSWFFVKHKNQGHWNASLPAFYVRTIGVLRDNIPNFDAGLKYVIFGKGGTHIYQFEGGFLTSLEGEHSKEDHPLNQALRQFDPDMNPDISQGLWRIDKGSTLSLYDHRWTLVRKCGITFRPTLGVTRSVWGEALLVPSVEWNRCCEAWKQVTTEMFVRRVSET
ncbi:hypothetical protein FPV67DRAFT_1501922 [Lyophyllum atratum]|nr:hypothetical protein FPV67DRAFT_1501922 [Lyophyllum atratum]